MALMVEDLLCLVTMLSHFDILGGTHKWVNSWLYIFIAAMTKEFNEEFKNKGLIPPLFPKP